MTPYKFVKVLPLLAALVAAPFAGQAQISTGGSDDVPTWKVGDQWDFARTFTLDLTIEALGLLTLPVPVVFTDNHRKIVAGVEIADNGTTGTLPTVAYRRNRAQPSTFTVGGSGSGSTLGTTVRFSLAVPNPTTSQGYDWVAVGDLSLIRENLETVDPVAGTAHIEAEGFLAGTVCDQLEGSADGLHCRVVGSEPVSAGDNPFTLDFTLNVDHAAPTGGTSGGLEYMDFPAQVANEAWTQSLRRNISGIFDLNVSNGGLQFSDSFDAGLEGSFASGNPLKIVSTSVASPSPGSFPGCIQVQGRFATTGALTDDIIYYNAGAKEMVSWRIGDIDDLVVVDDGGDFTVHGDLKNFLTRVSGVAVDSTTAVTDITYAPAPATSPLVSRSVAVCVSGTAPSGATVNAEVLQPGGGGSTASTVADPDGSFNVSLTTPATDDNTPSVAGSPNADEGSYGVRFTLNSDTTPAKVATIRLTSVMVEPPACPSGTECPTGGRPLGDFDCTGCTDIGDFLFLLDNWQLVVDGQEVGIQDFLNLLDNYQTGPNCA